MVLESRCTPSSTMWSLRCRRQSLRRWMPRATTRCSCAMPRQRVPRTLRGWLTRSCSGRGARSPVPWNDWCLHLLRWFFFDSFLFHFGFSLVQMFWRSRPKKTHETCFHSTVSWDHAIAIVVLASTYCAVHVGLNIMAKWRHWITHFCLHNLQCEVSSFKHSKNYLKIICALMIRELCDCCIILIM